MTQPAELHETFLRELHEWGGDIDIALANSGTELVPRGTVDRARRFGKHYRDHRDRLARLLGILVDAEGMPRHDILDDARDALLDVAPEYCPPDWHTEPELYREWTEWMNEGDQ